MESGVPRAHLDGADANEQLPGHCKIVDCAKLFVEMGIYSDEARWRSIQR
jgi:hypothetical protein